MNEMRRLESMKAYLSAQVEEIEKEADIYEGDLKRYIYSLDLDINKLEKLCDKIERCLHICSLWANLEERLRQIEKEISEKTSV